MWRQTGGRLRVLRHHLAAGAEDAAGDERWESQMPAPHPGRVLTDEQKRALYHNGFVVVRNVVAPAMVRAMHDAIERAPLSAAGRHGPPDDVMDLVFESDLRSILTGRLPARCSLAVASGNAL